MFYVTLDEAQVESISKRPQKWRLVAGVCVVRMPTLCRNEDPLVEEFKQLQDQVWFEKSRLSHFELQVLGFERAKKAREKKALEDERPEAEASQIVEVMMKLVQFKVTVKVSAEVLLWHWHGIVLLPGELFLFFCFCRVAKKLMSLMIWYLQEKRN